MARQGIAEGEQRSAVGSARERQVPWMVQKNPLRLDLTIPQLPLGVYKRLLSQQICCVFCHASWLHHLGGVDAV
jgi:hypothetical protein